jgi:hypothetical protein
MRAVMALVRQTRAEAATPVDPAAGGGSVEIQAS